MAGERKRTAKVLHGSRHFLSARDRRLITAIGRTTTSVAKLLKLLVEETNRVLRDARCRRVLRGLGVLEGKGLIVLERSGKLALTERGRATLEKVEPAEPRWSTIRGLSSRQPGVDVRKRKV